MNQDSTSSFIENILIIVSNLPPEFRNTIIKKRLSEFNNFDQLEKKEVIKNILNNYNKIDKAKVLNLFESWINSLAEMDNSSINDIFNAYLLELYTNPQILDGLDESFILSLYDLFNRIDNNKKDKLWNCFMESISSTPNPERFTKLISTLKQ
jgi:hypothetical protein